MPVRFEWSSKERKTNTSQPSMNQAAMRRQESRPTDVQPSQNVTRQDSNSSSHKGYLYTIRERFLSKARTLHNRTPYLRRLPLPSLLIIAFLVLVNLLVWAICGLILTRHPRLLSTAALAYSLGLRHALDADHISAIDLMTRRLVASNQQPVTVGTFFSLGHSTIVVITSVVVAATAAGVSKRFNGFGHVGGIIGSSVSATFLILLGCMNAYILYKLLMQLEKVIHLQPEEEVTEGLKIEGGGVLFRILKKLFKLIDRPWKMYPLGVLFGLGFDTSSEIALLGISSIQGAKGTSIWLILIFPLLFTVGMCLVDTIDGALMMSLYVAPLQAGNELDYRHESISITPAKLPDTDTIEPDSVFQTPQAQAQQQKRPRSQTTLDPSTDHPTHSQTNQYENHQMTNNRVKSPLPFLYYSTVLTLLTVIVALVIGTIQLLTLIRNVAISDTKATTSPFWRGVDKAGEYYDVIGGAICGCFLIVGGISVLVYRPWRKWVDGVRQREREDRGEFGLLGDSSGSQGDGGHYEARPAGVEDEQHQPQIKVTPVQENNVPDRKQEDVAVSVNHTRRNEDEISEIC